VHVNVRIKNRELQKKKILSNEKNVSFSLYTY
jgi:hypothetical protein